ncbi:hypothetical protein BD410DRAFT_848600 [Rickenella mellea]|uniref:Photolyase/cryptochrome alpha/beta domain-containing protein n=1 Tax=Rickenella mellea TaxID=50990 RepID=A0A4R5XEM5_9AGAM|nr:hypothetical protein BD410DRAFT_848600 [Rickenella mellea]
MSKLKRPTSPLSDGSVPHKRHRSDSGVPYIKISSFENAAAVDKVPPLKKLQDLMSRSWDNSTSGPGLAVVYWMRMADLRIEDNRALARASSMAQKENIPLIAMYAISPQDYEAHDRSARRIDFMLRNLVVLKEKFNALHIPFYVFNHRPRKTLPQAVVALLESWRVTNIFANLEYEVDELRRDIRVWELGKQKGIRSVFLHDRVIVDPGVCKTKQDKPYTANCQVYSPWLKTWTESLNKNLVWLEAAPAPHPNDISVRGSTTFGDLFRSDIPDFVNGFECCDAITMRQFWPAGTEHARQILDRFFTTKAKSTQLGNVSPLAEGAESSVGGSRIIKYGDDRDKADIDSTSRISPYLASGVISAREIVRKTMDFLKIKKVEASRGNGVGIWVQELAWRDFYNHVLTSFPRVSMGRPFQEKFADVKWETNEIHLQAWKVGKTGVPIVDAAMRQLNTMGWMHNRCRMITAMYLTKDLMLDWRLGEKYFMENLIDGDLASNNGGWQWSASTGTDPQPYFRIFNPYAQSEKADPTGNYIRHYVPELAGLKGKGLRFSMNSSTTLSYYGQPDGPIGSSSNSGSLNDFKFKSSLYIPQRGGTPHAPDPTSSDTTLKEISDLSNMDVDWHGRDETIAESTCLVLDTNILLRYLEVIEQFTEDLEKCSLSPLVTIVIPGIVVQELDYQKKGRNENLAWFSRTASTWILKKLKEHKTVRGQSYGETCQRSGKWTIRDMGESNDSLIVDCALYFKRKQGQRVFVVSEDKNLSSMALFNDLAAINPNAKWSSRELAAQIFGHGCPVLRNFRGYQPSYRNSKVKKALDDELGPQPPAQVTDSDDTMEVDDDYTSNIEESEPPPSHILDSTHLQIIQHFTILLLVLVERVASHMFKQVEQKRSGSAASIHAPESGPPPKTAADCVEYLIDFRSGKFPRSAPPDSLGLIQAGGARLRDFLTKPYQRGARRGQDWTRADWVYCLTVLETLGDVWEESSIRISLHTLAPHLDGDFRKKMRPTGI